MNKKICALVIILTFILSMFVLPTNAVYYTDVPQGMYYSDAVEALTTYGIISGYGGSFRPDAPISRAEFAKIATIISGLEDVAYSNAGNKKFDDVPLEHWATGYINTVANNKIIIGYPDGSFQPERYITCAEALTVVLRTLGYSTAELGDNWPYAYMVKARGLGLSDELNISDYAPISRADVAVIVNRALQTEINNSNLKLVNNLEISVLEDVFVIATQAEDSTLAVDEIRTTSGVYSLDSIDFNTSVPTQGDLMLNKDGKVINFAETEKFTRTFTTVENIVNGEIYFSNGTSNTSLAISNNIGVYNDGVVSTFGAFKANIKEGASVSIVYDKYNAVKFLVFGNAEYTEAVTVGKDIYTALSAVGVSKEMIDNATIIRDGYSSSLDEVEKYDVAYYLAENSTIYLYSDKISGVYTEAFPKKANVTSVDISGTVLELETQTAAHKLGEKPGSFKLGSVVTALLGKDGKIVDVIALDSSDKSNYGVVLACSVEESTEIKDKGKQYNYITFLNGEGHTMKYKTAKNYDDYIGYIGKLSYDESGYAVFDTLSNSKVITGAVDKKNRKIGDYWLTSDCIIIERTSASTSSAQMNVIELDDIIPTELTEKHVIHAVTVGDFEDVSLLFVENVSSEQLKYGILKSGKGSSRGTSVNGSYEIFSNGKLSTYSTNFYNSIDNGSAVSMTYNGNSLISIKKIVTVGINKKVLAADISRVKLDTGVYKISDDVQVIKKTSSGYTSMSKSEIDDLEGKTVSVFADRRTDDGGLVRIILVLN